MTNETKMPDAIKAFYDGFWVKTDKEPAGEHYTRTAELREAVEKMKSPKEDTPGDYTRNHALDAVLELINLNERN